MQQEMVNGLTLWSCRIMDRMLARAAPEVEDQLAEMLLMMVLPSLSFQIQAVLNDNDN